MDAVTKPLPIFALQQVGDPNVGVCEGDACIVDSHHSQAFVNRQIDEGLV